MSDHKRILASGRLVMLVAGGSWPLDLKILEEVNQELLRKIECGPTK